MLCYVRRKCQMNVEQYWDSLDHELPLGNIVGTIEELWPQRSEF